MWAREEPPCGSCHSFFRRRSWASSVRHILEMSKENEFGRWTATRACARKDARTCARQGGDSMKVFVDDFRFAQATRVAVRVHLFSGEELLAGFTRSTTRKAS